MPPDADTANAIAAEQDRATMQSDEIQRIIDEHNMLAMNKEGGELVEVRQKCSRAIAEACARHVRENNAPAPAPLEEAKDGYQDKRELEPGGLLSDTDAHGNFVGGTDLAGDRMKGTG